MSSKITIHMVCSLDGFIAKKDDTTDWMHSKDQYENGIELTEDAITNFLQSIDCYIMGSRTYEHAIKLGWPYGETPVVVLSKRGITSEKDSVKIYSGDLEELVNQELKAKYKNIWMVGGTSLTKEFLQRKLADKIVVTIMPILLGEGLPFFDSIGLEQPLHLKDHVAFKDGMIELTYEVNK